MHMFWISILIRLINCNEGPALDHEWPTYTEILKQINQDEVWHVATNSISTVILSQTENYHQ